jgi:hypothetical protein
MKFKNFILNKIFKYKILYLIVKGGVKMAKKRIAKEEECECNHNHHGYHHHGHHALYGLGFIGAAIYYISTATGFWMGVLGILKALVWPAFLVFQLLKSLGM